ncbi:MAG TPA: DUF4326 domain-containing protein [Actinomycetota bacterium]|nr:DUF4326 domain-containing protein [Actinomycetota bacterium]
MRTSDATSAPRRVQLRRTNGWRKPPDAVVISRPSKWGNPYRVSEHGLLGALALYRRHLTEHPELAEAARRELAGKTLACWCRPDQPCHGDILFEVLEQDQAHGQDGQANDTPAQRGGTAWASSRRPATRRSTGQSKPAKP